MKGVTFIRPNLAQEFTKDILTPETLTRFAELVRTKVADGRTLEEVRRDRVEARPAKQARLDAGEPLDFLPENEVFTFLDGTTMTVKEIREADWKVDGQPPQFDGRRVQLTGPCSEPAMAIGAMNTGQQWMADSEDAAAQSTDSPLRTQRSLKLLCTWTPEGKRAIDGAGGKRLKPENEVAIMIYRPRGLHLDDRHLLVDGQAVSGGFVDAWLFLKANAKALLDRGLPVAFYLPKLECVEDADLWHTFLYETEKALDLAPGTVKVYLLVEIINATYQLEEMMYAFTRPIRDSQTGKSVPASRFIGPNVGRWDSRHEPRDDGRGQVPRGLRAVRLGHGAQARRRPLGRNVGQHIAPGNPSPGGLRKNRGQGGCAGPAQRPSHPDRSAGDLRAAS
jgi:malate synthase